MAKPLAPGPSRLEVEIAIAKLKRYKSPGSDQIPAELIQPEGEMSLSAIHKLINFVWNTEKCSDNWKESIIVPVHKKGDNTGCNKISRVITAFNFKHNFIEYPPMKVQSTTNSMELNTTREATRC
jgi:hypothetical protein